MAEEKESKGINISGTHGDVFGVGVSGSGNVIGKNIVVGSGTINVNEQRLTEIQNNEYAQSLKAFLRLLMNDLRAFRYQKNK